MTIDRKLLRNLYKLADYHASQNRCRSNDLSRDDVLRARDGGLASAYEYITTMLQREDVLAQVDYDRANNRHTDLPTWMEGDTE